MSSKIPRRLNELSVKAVVKGGKHHVNLALITNVPPEVIVRAVATYSHCQVVLKCWLMRLFYCVHKNKSSLSKRVSSSFLLFFCFFGVKVRNPTFAYKSWHSNERYLESVHVSIGHSFNWFRWIHEWINSVDSLTLQGVRLALTSRFKKYLSRVTCLNEDHWLGVKCWTV